MATKIQINDLKALQALLGADPEFEVEFRNAVVAELHNRLVVPTVERRVQCLVETEVNHHLGSADRYGGQVKLAPKIKEAVEQAVRDEAYRILQETVKKIVAELLSKDVIQQAVINEATRRAVAEAINDCKAKMRQAVLENT